MFEIHNYAGFVAAILLFQLIPGAGTLAILATTGRYGLRAGVAAVLGTLLGDLIYMLAALLGVAAVLQNHPLWLSGLQWLGALYLLWYGVGLWRAPLPRLAAPPPAHHHLRRALLVCLTNPKAILFFFTFFPLFLSPGAGWGTLTAMLLHVSGIGLVYQLGLVVMGLAAARALGHRPWVGRWARRLAGVALVGLGLRLALERTE